MCLQWKGTLEAHKRSQRKCLESTDTPKLLLEYNFSPLRYFFFFFVFFASSPSVRDVGSVACSYFTFLLFRRLPRPRRSFGIQHEPLSIITPLLSIASLNVSDKIFVAAKRTHGVWNRLFVPWFLYEISRSASLFKIELDVFTPTKVVEIISEKTQDAYNLFHTSHVPIQKTQILSETFPDAMDNKGVIPCDNFMCFILYTLESVQVLFHQPFRQDGLSNYICK
jgi:hypothetical protein